MVIIFITIIVIIYTQDQYKVSLTDLWRISKECFAYDFPTNRRKDKSFSFKEPKDDKLVN